MAVAASGAPEIGTIAGGREVAFHYLSQVQAVMVRDDRVFPVPEVIEVLVADGHVRRRKVGVSLGWSSPGVSCRGSRRVHSGGVDLGEVLRAREKREWWWPGISCCRRSSSPMVLSSP
jgi:hypothetical protein